MKDERIDKMAYGLVNYSTRLKAGEKILIEVFDSGIPLAEAVVREAYKIGAVPFTLVRNKQLDRQIMMEATPEQMACLAEYELPQMKAMDAYIGIRAAENATELADVSASQQEIYMKNYMHPVLNQRVNHTKWTIMRYPTPSMAQMAGMSTEAFEDFYFKVCTLDYAKMAKAMSSLKKLMERSDKVRIVGVGTDLNFSIKGIPAIICAGEMNIPDGEVYTAPVKNSVNGVITYNTPTVYQGVTYENICLKFKDGKIVEATANDTARINKVFDTDEGARYVGEFSFGVNPYINTPMKDILFDEKINGSIHFTPGQAYEDADNSNRSSIHWDLVYIQRPEYGGGEIYLDDVLVRKDGRFVLPELECLNPENLV